MKIQDFENKFWLIKANADKLEIARVMRDTMNKGKVMMDHKDISFKPLSSAKTEMEIFSRLREFSLPKLKDTTLGKLLIWDAYAIRIKQA